MIPFDSNARMVDLMYSVCEQAHARGKSTRQELAEQQAAAEKIQVRI